MTHRMQELRARAGRAILLTEHVTPPLAEELRERDVSFVDACGNAYLRDDGLYVWVTSRPRAPRANRGRRGLHAAGLKLLYVLLRRRQHARNLRDLAAEAGIALGGVARILDELEERAWIRRARQSIELVEPAAMLKRWDDGYADTLRPKLLANACRRRPGTALEDLAREVARPALRDRILIGGELGAACVTRDLLPETATLHLDGIEAIDAMRELQLVPDPRGDVFLVHAFGRVQRATDAPDAEVPLADPLLIRGELLLRPIDRLRALAETLRADHIATRWT